MGPIHRSKSVDLRQVLERAIHGPLETSDILRLSLSSRCSLIEKLINSDELAIPKRIRSISKESLLRLSKSFDFSEEFHDWQRRKRQLLIQALMSKQGNPILSGYRNWDKISQGCKEWILRASARLHRDVYTEGIVEKLPYEHVFEEGAYRQSKGVLTLTFGIFSGSLSSGEGKITQFKHRGELPLDVKECFDTAHHEMTHAIQHHLAYAFSRNQLAPSHPLYSAAAYFYSIDKRKAYIPSSYQEAYDAQPTEIFANWEGEKISSAIHALAT